MTNQQVTADELGAKWGAILNQAFIAIVGLEKQLETQDKLIQEFRAQEAVLVDHIQELEGQLSAPDSRRPGMQSLDAAGRDDFIERSDFVKNLSGSDDKEKADLE